MLLSAEHRSIVYVELCVTKNNLPTFIKVKCKYNIYYIYSYLQFYRSLVIITLFVSRSKNRDKITSSSSSSILFCFFQGLGPIVQNNLTWYIHT